MTAEKVEVQRNSVQGVVNTREELVKESMNN